VIDEIIFAVDSGKLSELEEVFLLCDEEGVMVQAYSCTQPGMRQAYTTGQVDAVV